MTPWRFPQKPRMREHQHHHQHHCTGSQLYCDEYLARCVVLGIVLSRMCFVLGVILSRNFFVRYSTGSGFVCTGYCSAWKMYVSESCLNRVRGDKGVLRWVFCIFWLTDLCQTRLEFLSVGYLANLLPHFCYSRFRPTGDQNQRTKAKNWRVEKGTWLRKFTLIHCLFLGWGMLCC